MLAKCGKQQLGKAESVIHLLKFVAEIPTKVATKQHALRNKIMKQIILDIQQKHDFVC